MPSSIVDLVHPRRRSVDENRTSSLSSRTGSCRLAGHSDLPSRYAVGCSCIYRFRELEKVFAVSRLVRLSHPHFESRAHRAHLTIARRDHAGAYHSSRHRFAHKRGSEHPMYLHRSHRSSRVCSRFIVHVLDRLCDARDIHPVQSCPRSQQNLGRHPSPSCLRMEELSHIPEARYTWYPYGRNGMVSHARWSGNLLA